MFEIRIPDEILFNFGEMPPVNTDEERKTSKPSQERKASTFGRKPEVSISKQDSEQVAFSDEVCEIGRYILDTHKPYQCRTWALCGQVKEYLDCVLEDMAMDGIYAVGISLENNHVEMFQNQGDYIRRLTNKTETEKSEHILRSSS